MLPCGETLAKVEESHGSCAWWWRSIAAVIHRLTNPRIAFEGQEQWHFFHHNSITKKKSLIPFVQVYMDGTTTMSTHERKASLREFYGNLLAILTISAHQSFPLSSLKASYQQRQKLLISIDPDNIQISQSRKICAMCLVAPSLQTFPTSQLQWAGSGRKDLLVKRHHYIWELYIEACFCMIFQTFDLPLVQSVF